MFVRLVFASSFISSVFAVALRPQQDGFVLEELNGERHFTYGVIPSSPGQKVRLEFYDVDFDGQNCDDIRVDIYRNGYFKMDRDLVYSLCDAEALGQLVLESTRGFIINLDSSRNVHRGQIKARFSSMGGIKVTHEVLHK